MGVADLTIPSNLHEPVLAKPTEDARVVGNAGPLVNEKWLQLLGF